MIKRFLPLTILFLLISVIAYAQEKPRIGVLRFTNHTRAGWWSAEVGDELQDMLASELSSTNAFQVLERTEINVVLSEQDLSASGRVSNETKVQMKKLKGAKYLIAGTVSAFEEDTAGTGGGVRLGGIKVGGEVGKAYLAVDVKVVDTETGEIVDTRTIEATAKKSGISLGVSSGKFGANLGKYAKTPVGKAIRACIVYISEYLECSLGRGKDDECMEKWNKMDAKRREKTKSTIKLE